jgi:acetoin utilization deacetylase AcuC-like enzyme
VRRLGPAGRRPPILIVDLDLHQGDGNALFFANEPDVFTFSMHESGLFPQPRQRSDLDIELPGWTGDDQYLMRLDQSLATIEARFDPAVVIYVAGTDPYEDDPLGTLMLSPEGLEERDRRVARFAAKHRCGLVVVPAGGYSEASPLLTAVGLEAIAELASVEARRPQP